MNTVPKFKSIEEVKKYNRKHGMKFFEPDTMRFFDSKIIHSVFRGNYFITSEQFHGSRGYSGDRKYTVRVALNGGRIETIPKFQAFEDIDGAIKYIKSLPEYLPEALQFLNDCFGGDLQKFVDQALIEPVNDPHGEYTMDSFTGSCSWLCDHYMSIDDAVLEMAGKMYDKQLTEHINEV